jgi:hypothetical protein
MRAPRPARPGALSSLDKRVNLRHGDRPAFASSAGTWCLHLCRYVPRQWCPRDAEQPPRDCRRSGARTGPSPPQRWACPSTRCTTFGSAPEPSHTEVGVWRGSSTRNRGTPPPPSPPTTAPSASSWTPAAAHRPAPRTTKHRTPCRRPNDHQIADAHGCPARHIHNVGSAGLRIDPTNRDRVDADAVLDHPPPPRGERPQPRTFSPRPHHGPGLVVVACGYATTTTIADGSHDNACRKSEADCPGQSVDVPGSPCEYPLVPAVCQLLTRSVAMPGLSPRK